MSGATLLGERAMLGGFRVPGRVSAGGGCRLYDARDGVVALNLSRPSDAELLPALFETDNMSDVAALIAEREALPLVARGREMGLAIAAEHEAEGGPACVTMTGTAPVLPPNRPLRVLDLSALWAGPLAAHLLGLAGAQVVKAESRTRPDAMRDGDAIFFALLNSGKVQRSIDLHREGLLTLIAGADIVIEAARPRALRQLGVDADAVVRERPGLVWITITAHGATGDAANWIGFGDDCGVAAGLSAALREATGRTGFVGDAIADPLTGILAARTAWDAWRTGRGGRYGLSMRGVVAQAMEQADPVRLMRSLLEWGEAEGAPFPAVERRGC